MWCEDKELSPLCAFQYIQIVCSIVVVVFLFLLVLCSTSFFLFFFFCVTGFCFRLLHWLNFLYHFPHFCFFNPHLILCPVFCNMKKKKWRLYCSWCTVHQSTFLPVTVKLNVFPVNHCHQSARFSRILGSLQTPSRDASWPPELIHSFTHLTCLTPSQLNRGTSRDQNAWRWLENVLIADSDRERMYL